MALVNHKTDVLDVDDEVHKAFYPYKNKREALEQEDSPPIVDPLPPVVSVAREGASVWVPPEDYFSVLCMPQHSVPVVNHPNLTGFG